jgi:hypothetical protein
MSARFLLTVDEGPKTDPEDAARLVRAGGTRNLLDALREVEIRTRQGLLQNQTIYLPLDHVLLMIGITDELVDACGDAQLRARNIASDDGQAVQRRRYVRVKASPTRTDTVIAIATTHYWGTRQPIVPWKALMGRDDYYCSLIDMRRYPDVDPQTTSLPEMIRACQGEKAWVTL